MRTDTRSDPDGLHIIYCVQMENITAAPQPSNETFFALRILYLLSRSI